MKVFRKYLICISCHTSLHNRTAMIHLVGATQAYAYTDSLWRVKGETCKFCGCEIFETRNGYIEGDE